MFRKIPFKKENLLRKLIVARFPVPAADAAAGKIHFKTLENNPFFIYFQADYFPRRIHVPSNPPARKKKKNKNVFFEHTVCVGNVQTEL